MENQQQHFYIVETKYVGPNQNDSQYVDADTIEITKTPARGNLSGDVVTEGWCGETGGWAVYAHGEYASLEIAQAAVAEIFGEVRDCDPNHDEFESDDPDVVEVYKQGEYAPMSRQETADWACEGIQSDIQADTTDDQISELLKEYELIANGDGYTLDSDIKEFMENARQEKRDELITINSEECYCRGGDLLSPLGGCTDYGDQFGLGDWTYQFEITATNKDEEKEFTIAFQPVDRNNRLEAYSGHEIAPASGYGYDADESSELVEFFEGDETALNALAQIAKAAAKEELALRLKDL